ncbi:MAG: hypothetical protein FWC19_04205 [Treponema sp.]|nr:hypothetical protein [Treponema sp.]MCL2271995.1 hypothetical protein [Treponema sp.]
MKKFLFTLFILLALGGVGFFFGWVQLKVPPGSFGIINSKTHGVDPIPVRSGEFRWLWLKLIPTNVQISVFRPETMKFPIEFNSSLPSGNSYASFAGMGTSDFSWKLDAEISFSISPDMLVPIVSKYNLTDQESLDAYMQDIASNIKIIILRNLSSAETDASRIERILSGAQDTVMEQEIKNRFPEIRDFTFTVTSAAFPDFTLYRQVRLLYEEFLSKQREYVSTAFGRRAEGHIEIQLRLMELEGYGELLSKYPILLDYLALEMKKDEQ